MKNYDSIIIKLDVDLDQIGVYDPIFAEVVRILDLREYYKYHEVYVMFKQKNSNHKVVKLIKSRTGHLPPTESVESFMGLKQTDYIKKFTKT